MCVQITTASDIWSAGLVTLETLTGKLPWSASTDNQVAYQLIKQVRVPELDDIKDKEGQLQSRIRHPVCSLALLARVVFL